MHYTDYTCFLVSIPYSTAPSNGARKRRSADNHGNITADNIYIGRTKQDGDQLAVEVAAIYPSADGKITSSSQITPAQTLKQQIVDSQPEINSKLQSKFSDAVKVSEVEATPRKSTAQKRQSDSKTPKGTIAAVVVVVLLIIVIAIALLIYFSRCVTVLLYYHSLQLHMIKGWAEMDIRSLMCHQGQREG